MTVTPTDLPEVLLVETPVHRDERGYFEELYRAESMPDPGAAIEFVQDNHSRSHRNVLRGLHYQEPDAQGKMVLVISGAVQDVVVDVRTGSPNFGKWISVELREGDGRCLWIPEGFAHGILALEDSTDLLYKVTNYWSPVSERTIRWDDPGLAIDWQSDTPVLNEKDANAPLLREARHLPKFNGN